MKQLDSFGFLRGNKPTGKPSVSVLQSELEMNGTQELPEWPTWQDFEAFKDGIAVPSKHPFLEDERLFKFYAKPAKKIQPDSDRKILFVGGLGACTIGWRLTANYIFNKTNYSVYCTPLPGHDGTWDSLKNTTPEVWIDRLEEFVHEENLDDAICVGHSSGTLPCLLLKAKKPALFKKIIGIGVPFFLTAPMFDFRINASRVLDTISRLVTFNSYSFLESLKIPAGKSLAPPADEIERVNVTYSHMPGPVFSTLKACIDKTKTALPAMDKASLSFLQGEHDLVVSRELCRAFLESLDFDLEIIKNAPHAVHVSREWQVLADRLVGLV